MFSGVIALSLALVSRHSGAARGLSRFILGDILTVTDEEILALAGLALVTVIFLALFFNHLILESLSPTLARTRRPGLSRFLPYLFGLWLALTATVAVWSVGLLLVTALLVAPAAAGRAAAGQAAAGHSHSRGAGRGRLGQGRSRRSLGLPLRPDRFRPRSRAPVPNGGGQPVGQGPPDPEIRPAP